MNFPEFPVAFGVIRAVEEDTYSLKMKRQIEYIQKNSKIKNVDDLLRSGNTWEV
jgi:2-oxoglutarate ferredoxin oxidoreductase subunit beta